MDSKTLTAIRERDARYGDWIPGWWSCQRDRRALLSEVERLKLKLNHTEEVASVEYRHWVILEGAESYRWDFHTFDDAMRVIGILSRQKSNEPSCLYYQRSAV